MSGVAVALIGGTVVIAGVFYYISKKEKAKKLDKNRDDIEELLSEEGRYSEYKSLIENAIESKDYDFLEECIDSRMRDFPDLIEMIKKALEQRDKS